jgi:hypothetical protein
MRKGITRRQWLAGLVAGLCTPWLARVRPAAASGAAHAAGATAASCLASAPYDAFGTVTTYAYDSVGPLARGRTVTVYDGANRVVWSRGPFPTTSYSYTTFDSDPRSDPA